MLKHIHIAIEDAKSFENLKYFFISLLITLAIFYLAYRGIVASTDLGLSEYGIVNEYLRSIINFVAQILILPIAYFLMAPVIFLVLSFFSDVIGHNIYQKRYQAVAIEASIGPIEAVWETIKITLKYILLFVIASPALLLFGAGHILFAIISFLLFRRLLLIDALGAHMSLTEIRARSSIFSGGAHGASSLILFLLSLVPVLNLFVPYLAICLIVNESLAARLEETQKI